MEKESFESALANLEKAVENLEQGDLTLEASLHCFEMGVKSLTACQKYLREAENQVEILLKNQDGTLQSSPFDLEDS